jgi:hypothetical protein
MEKINTKEKIVKFNNFSEFVEYIENKADNNTVLIIDIDGVLVKMDINLFLKGLFFYLFNKTKFKKFILEHKINFGNLKNLIKLSKKGINIILFTGRLKSENKNFFPFISKNFIEKLQKYNISVITHHKIINLFPQELFNKIKNSNKIFYLGSNILDRNMFNKLKSKIKNKVLEYFEIKEKTKIF